MGKAYRKVARNRPEILINSLNYLKIYGNPYSVFNRGVTVTHLSRRLAAEAIGVVILLATVVGSGIMAQRLAGGNAAVALFGNTVPICAMLVVLITMLRPISGAHFNPIVTLIAVLDRTMPAKVAVLYVMVQVAGSILGTWLAHLMFGLSLFETSHTVRTGWAQWLSEAVASFWLIFTIFAAHRADKRFVPVAVALYVLAACWFTGSAAFLNPAATLARSLSDSFTGIRPADVPMFAVAQLAGGLIAWRFSLWLLKPAEA